MAKTFLQIVTMVLLSATIIVASAYTKTDLGIKAGSRQQAMACYLKLVERAKTASVGIVYKTQGGADNWMEARYYPKNGSFNIASGLPSGSDDPGAASVFFSDRDLDGKPDRAAYYDGSLLYSESSDNGLRTISENSEVMWEVSLVMLIEHTQACS